MRNIIAKSLDTVHTHTHTHTYKFKRRKKSS